MHMRVLEALSRALLDAGQSKLSIFSDSEVKKKNKKQPYLSKSSFYSVV